MIFNDLGHIYELNIIKSSSIEITEDPSIKQLKLNYDFKLIENLNELTADTYIGALILHSKKSSIFFSFKSILFLLLIL